ncbi:hypothetical protein V8V91_14780 [Algoriphagus halophilus]|uniref:hypothetical protein n=1 Tax=Algoriphagus halophilus TaxID=226505 RepID=UPI00358E29A7
MGARSHFLRDGELSDILPVGRSIEWKRRVVNLIKEPLQINIHDVLIAIIDVYQACLTALWMSFQGGTHSCVPRT